MQNMNVTGMDAFAAMATATLIQVLGSTPAHLISERVADLVDPLLGALQGQFVRCPAPLRRPTSASAPRHRFLPPTSFFRPD